MKKQKNHSQKQDKYNYTITHHRTPQPITEPKRLQVHVRAAGQIKWKLNKKSLILKEKIYSKKDE